MLDDPPPEPAIFRYKGVEVTSRSIAHQKGEAHRKALLKAREEREEKRAKDTRVPQVEPG